MELIQRNLNCAVALVHHTGKDPSRGVRGSNAIPAAVDAAHEIVAHKDTKAVAMHCRRMKDAPEAEQPWTFEMRQIGASLVPFEVTRDAFKLLAPSDDKLQMKAIATALAGLGAKGPENHVTTHVLASAMVVAGPEDSPEEHEERVSLLARVLKARSARTGYDAYSYGRGRELMWGLPSEQE
jgi:hypothetical protein